MQQKSIIERGSISIIEPQGGFTHEIVNIALIEQELEAGKDLVVIGSEAFIVNCKSILQQYSHVNFAGRILFVPLMAPTSSWKLDQLTFELIALKRSQSCEEVLFFPVVTPPAICANIFPLVIRHCQIKLVPSSSGNLCQHLKSFRDFVLSVGDVVILYRNGKTKKSPYGKPPLNMISDDAKFYGTCYTQTSREIDPRH